METFVVRVWRAADEGLGSAPKSAAQLHGLVEHVGSGTTTRFVGDEELLRFLRRSALPGNLDESSRSSSSEGDR
jgi:hypothetical protein